MPELIEITKNVLYNENIVTLSLSYYKGEHNLYEDDELKRENDRRVMDAARKSIGYLSSAEIREIRGKYTEDPEIFGKLLGFENGEMTKYEDMYFPDKMKDYLIEAQKEPLIFLGSLFRYRYLLTFDVFYNILNRTMNCMEMHIDKKSVENLKKKWGDYLNINFFIDYILQVGGGIFTYNDYEKVTHGYQIESRYMKTRIHDYPKDAILVQNLKEEIRFWLQEEAINMELGFKTYNIKGWSKEWEERIYEVEG